ncbi:AAA family ATPase [Streptomyces sp. NPDC050619]|uniref:AAA family ATPase n=1 Tax=Streptomyces sp. NPDC050619 TaxID=3157214 RepID=UPI00341AE0D1
MFGAAPQKEGDKDASLRLDFGPAANVLVGENDSGKTAIIDAIRLCLLTTAADFYRITRDDFHVGPGGRAGTFKITCGFKDLTTEEQAVFLELLTTDEEGNVALYVTVKAELMDPLRPHRVAMTTRTGRDGQGPALDGAAREPRSSPGTTSQNLPTVCVLSQRRCSPSTDTRQAARHAKGSRTRRLLGPRTPPRSAQRDHQSRHRPRHHRPGHVPRHTDARCSPVRGQILYFHPSKSEYLKRPTRMFGCGPPSVGRAAKYCRWSVSGWSYPAMAITTDRRGVRSPHLFAWARPSHAAEAGGGVMLSLCAPTGGDVR